MEREAGVVAHQDHPGSKPEIGLVKASVFLAVFLEVIPVETDAIHIMFASGQIARAVAFKIICLTLILLPLAVYVSRNGLGALKIVRGRVAVVCFITLARLATFSLMVYSYMFARPG